MTEYMGLKKSHEHQNPFQCKHLFGSKNVRNISNKNIKEHHEVLKDKSLLLIRYKHFLEA